VLLHMSYGAVEVSYAYHQVHELVAQGLGSMTVKGLELVVNFVRAPNVVLLAASVVTGLVLLEILRAIVTVVQPIDGLFLWLRAELRNGSTQQEGLLGRTNLHGVGTCPALGQGFADGSSG